MDLPNLLSITPIYVAVLGLVFVLITLRVGFYRVNSKILIGTGEDPEMLRRVRGQANFIETVPMALFLLVVMEVLGAPGVWLHSLCAALVVARISHYLGLTELAPVLFRVAGMTATLLVVLISAVWILIDSF